MKKQVKGLDWFKKTILCMNIDIRKSQHESYKTQRQILKHVRPPHTQQEIDESEGTLSFNRWNQGTVNWADYVDVTSMPSSSTAKGNNAAMPEDEDID